MASGVDKSRPLAVAVCKERGWTAGATLASSSWARNRQVLEVGVRFVTLLLIKKGTTARDRVVTFPPDVHLVGGSQ